MTFGFGISRRQLLVLGSAALLAGCKVIPAAGPGTLPPPDTSVRPDASVLPTDSKRHRVALLVPLTGAKAELGQALANAAVMAVMDAGADNVRITNYDVAANPASAAAQAIADGNKLILGPLDAGDIPVVSATARPARVPVVSFTNDERAAGRGVFVMGQVPGQSIDRTISYAHQHGMSRIAALVPAGDYGQRASAALLSSARAQGASVTAIETFYRSKTSLLNAVKRLRDRGGYDAVLIADGARMARQAAPMVKTGGSTEPRLLGTELWSGELSIAMTPELRGALFSAVSDTHFRRFAESYRARFGSQPPRAAAIAYDSVLLTIRLTKDWKVGTPLPAASLTQGDGFVGVDGAFRFGSDGVIRRAFEVREVEARGVNVVSPAPRTFGD